MLASLRVAFDVIDYSEPLEGLLRIGKHPPDAVVVAGRLGHLSGAEIIEALKRESHTRHVRAVLFANDEDERKAALEAGASAQVSESDLIGLRDTLEALMGVRH
jgi:DNA-binding NarL/FixJ family response regulator